MLTIKIKNKELYLSKCLAMHFKNFAITLLLLLTTLLAFGQDVYHHVTNQGVYELIDELANMGVIRVNSSVKPYSRKQISQLLTQANSQPEKLSKRQKAEIAFYLNDFGKEQNITKDFPRRFDALYHKDSLFALTLNPVLGVNTLSNSGDVIYRRWVGAEMWGYIGANFAMYASLRDYNENIRLGDKDYLNHFQGGGYKPNADGGEFSEMRGGLSYGWNWGSISLVKDHLEWGSGYNGTNILYSKAPSFTMIKLNVKPSDWFELNFIHGWLVSQVIDSSRIYNYDGQKRDMFHPKYIAANLFTLTPFDRLNVSFGNSIIYSDMDIHPAYFTPLFFYKSIDHHLNGMSNSTGQNSQMFFDISSRLIKHTHMYATLFFDELSMSRMFDAEKHSNFFSLKAGIRLSNFPIKNLTLTAEYTRNNPQTFEHIIETTTFESNMYNLGHYLRENAQELYLAASVKPFKNLSILVSYTNAQKGPYTSEEDSRLGLIFLEHVDWRAQLISTTVRYQVLNDSYVYAGIDYGNYSGNTEQYTPSFLTNSPITITFGGNYGF
ncbi:MAG TPA: hypothetical protein ENN24_07405 [Bacteroidetes bacterium]|nr:hypothetical protein [Bacteroidota bacterium]